MLPVERLALHHHIKNTQEKRRCSSPQVEPAGGSTICGHSNQAIQSRASKPAKSNHLVVRLNDILLPYFQPSTTSAATKDEHVSTKRRKLKDRLKVERGMETVTLAPTWKPILEEITQIRQKLAVMGGMLKNANIGARQKEKLATRLVHYRARILTLPRNTGANQVRDDIIELGQYAIDLWQKYFPNGPTHKSTISTDSLKVNLNIALQEVRSEINLLNETASAINLEDSESSEEEGRAEGRKEVEKELSVARSREILKKLSEYEEGNVEVASDLIKSFKTFVIQTTEQQKQLREKEIQREKQIKKETEENIERKTRLEQLLTNLNEKLSNKMDIDIKELSTSPKISKTDSEMKHSFKDQNSETDSSTKSFLKRFHKLNERGETAKLEKEEKKQREVVQENKRIEKSRPNLPIQSSSNSDSEEHNRRTKEGSQVAPKREAYPQEKRGMGKSNKGMEKARDPSGEGNKSETPLNELQGSSRNTLRILIEEYQRPPIGTCYNYNDYDTEYDEQVEELLIAVDGDARPFVEVNVLGISMIGLLDSGAQKSVLGKGAEKLIKLLKLKLFPSNVALKVASGEALEIVGYVNLPITFNQETHIIPTLVAPKLKRGLILGYEDFWKAFKVIPTLQDNRELAELNSLEDELETDLTANHLSENEKELLEGVKKIFKVAVEGEILETTHLITHKIELKEEYKNSPPIRLNPYPTSPKMQAKINQELDNMLAQDVIEPSKSDWALATVAVLKPSGEVRLCLDARRLNERTKRDAYPLPHQDRILSRLGSSKYLSTIDLSKAFLQIPLDPSSRKYTAFSVMGRGLFQFKRLFFGGVNSAAGLVRLMDTVLGFGELEPNVFVYLDDIVVANETFEEHLETLREVARRLREANLSINLKKSQFGVRELTYLGYMLTSEGLKPNPERIEPIVNYERPTSIRSLRRFLGMANYYRRFIPKFSEMTAPLTNLLKKKPKSIKWTSEAEVSFNRIKEALITAPVLASPNFNLPFHIQTDASDTAVAAILTQDHPEGERVVAYYSQKLSPAQQAYAASEKEGLAVLSAIDKFRPYIEATRFVVTTDASALTHIMRGKWRSSSRLCRWSIELQSYDLEIRHRRGRDNIIPDALSRAIESIDAVTDSWYQKLYQSVLSSPDEHIDYKIENNKLFKFIPTQTETLDYRL
ncbi:uncharacterized protein LOC129752031 [Uranotaenia lowii]|uniref:uncharacterized protein LOC129752031 n=1 Tax=Uranotaenia lowii TaxID=190385 RepID=UPI00247907AD|nr:uncharacterized protein LOC129752031 [Uranotaenia lowii]